MAQKKKSRQSHSPSFKATLARRVLAKEDTITAIAKEAGISAGMLGTWAKALKRFPDVYGPPPSSAAPTSTTTMVSSGRQPSLPLGEMQVSGVMVPNGNGHADEGAPRETSRTRRDPASLWEELTRTRAERDAFRLALETYLRVRP
jgi:hypothetical protein